MKKLLFIITIVIVILIGILVTKANTSEDWSLFLYTDQDNGLEHIDQWNKFSSKEDCLMAARSALKAGTPLTWSGCKDKCIVDRFVCGKDCSIDELFGSVFVSNILCTERISSQTE